MIFIPSRYNISNNSNNNTSNTSNVDNNGTVTCYHVANTEGSESKREEDRIDNIIIIQSISSNEDNKMMIEDDDSGFVYTKL